MNLKVEYWMLGLLEELLQNQKIKNQKSKWNDHKNCSVYCKNRWCERYGQINLIILRIQSLRREVEEEFKKEASK